MPISGHTRLYCLIGNPVAHSLSPFIHNRAFEGLGINGVYAAFGVSVDQLGEAIAGLETLGVAGANVTYPHKEAVLPFADERSERVEILRAANTLRFTPGGIVAHNTDAPGTAVAIEKLGGRSLMGRKVLIFGAGGAGRAAALGVLEAGAASVTFCELLPAKAEMELLGLQGRFPDRDLSVLSMSEEERGARGAAVAEASILINATPPVAGTIGAANLIEEPKWICPEHLCFEFSYHQRLTAFLRTARDGGATCLDGLCLLVAQALESFRRWTGEEFDLEEMAAALESHAGAGLVSQKE
ncbi:MAG: shikimate dehydrogenase [Candidatus Eisenbacteria sp.]|nr:shikimate dehydrogenase [Candidatus Eisenbacteria bacterium]